MAIGIQIRKAEASPHAIDPGELIFKHHRAGHAQVRIETLTGGHLLHLAVAGCLFNDILRVAAERGITVNQLEVSAERRLRRRTGGLYWNQLLSAGRWGRPRRRTTPPRGRLRTGRLGRQHSSAKHSGARCRHTRARHVVLHRAWVELKPRAPVHILGLADRRAATVSLVGVTRQLGTTVPQAVTATELMSYV